MEALLRVRAILPVKLVIAREGLHSTNACRRVLRLVGRTVLAMVDCTSYGVVVMGSMGAGLPVGDFVMAMPPGSLLWFHRFCRILVRFWRRPFRVHVPIDGIVWAIYTQIRISQLACLFLVDLAVEGPLSRLQISGRHLPRRNKHPVLARPLRNVRLAGGAQSRRALRPIHGWRLSTDHYPGTIQRLSSRMAT